MKSFIYRVIYTIHKKSTKWVDQLRKPGEDLWIHGDELLFAQLPAWAILQETLVPFLGKQRWPTKDKSMKTFATRAFICILVHSEFFHPSIHSGQVNFGVKESPRSIVKLHFNDRFKFHIVSQPLISSLALIVSLVSLAVICWLVSRLVKG